MFERDIRDASHLKRWAIVRTLRDQSVAEHSFYVAVYTNDICISLNMPPEITLPAIQYALWHDVSDEIFTGDIPGPSKRALLGHGEAKRAWSYVLNNWVGRVFNRVDERMGKAPTDHGVTVQLIVKLADWLDAAYEMAGEAQMGNSNAYPIARDQMSRAEQAAHTLFNHLGYDHSKVMDLWIPGDEETQESRASRLLDRIKDSFAQCMSGHSKAPHITVSE